MKIKSPKDRNNEPPIGPALNQSNTASRTWLHELGRLSRRILRLLGRSDSRHLVSLPSRCKPRSYPTYRWNSCSLNCRLLGASTCAADVANAPNEKAALRFPVMIMICVLSSVGYHFLVHWFVCTTP
jgi:hypothetical protein